MQDDRFHFVSNQPSQYEINDYFFVLDGAEVVSAHTEKTDTSDGLGVHYGIPSMKYM